MHSHFIWRRNPTKTLGFLLTWISPWFFIGFLLSPPPYAQSFLRKPSFLVLADFFPWFFKSKQLLGFLGVVFMLKQGPNRNIIFYLNIIKVEYSKGDIQTCQWVIGLCIHPQGARARWAAHLPAQLAQQALCHLGASFSLRFIWLFCSLCASGKIVYTYKSHILTYFYWGVLAV